METAAKVDLANTTASDLVVEVASLKEQNEQLRAQLMAVYERNNRVELNKRWETSTTRFICVACITYLTMNLILWSIDGPFPPVHAIIPTVGYMLSTLSLPKVKSWWMSKQKA